MKYLFTLLISLLILIAVLIPGSNLPDVNLVGLDKFVHIGLFGLWTMAVYFDFKLTGFQYVIAFVAGLVFSLFTEVLQFFVEGRTFDWLDTLADVFGLAAGLTIGAWLIRMLLRKFQKN